MNEHHATPKWRDGLLISLLALVAYLLCGRFAWHGLDSIAFLNQYSLGGTVTEPPWHTFYMPLLHVGHDLVTPFGGGAYRGGLLISAAGTAIGVWFTHAAARALGVNRATAIYAALLVATMPATTYFAVVVEVPGVVLAFSGWTWLCIAHWARKPGLGTAVLAGVSLAVAYLAHPTAAFVGLTMLPIYHLAQPVPRWRPLLVGTAAALAVLLIGMLLLPHLVNALGGSSNGSGRALEFLRNRSSKAHARGVTRILVDEWLVPFLPIHLPLLTMLLRRGSRLVVAGCLLAALPFVLASWLLLVEQECEHGAYATAICGPLAIAVAMHVRSHWWRALSLALGSATSIVLGIGLQETSQALATASAVELSVRGRDLRWLIADGAGPDGRVWLTRYPNCKPTLLAYLLQNQPEKLAANLDALDAMIAAHATAGGVSIVTSNTLEELANVAPLFPPARIIEDWLLAHRGPALGHADGVEVFAVQSHN